MTHKLLLSKAPVAAGGFDPLSLGWSHAWWAEGPAFQALGPSDGVGAQTWPDEIGSADMAQTDSGKRPLYASSVARLNGRPGIDPDGTDDFYEFTTGAFSSPYSIVAICAPFNGWTFHRLVDSFGTGPSVDIPGGSRVARLGGSASVNVSYLGNYNARLFTMLANDASSVIEVDGTPGTVGTMGSFNDWTAGVARAFASETDDAFLVDPVAFIGMASGDIRSDANWAAFEAWAQSHYGTP